MWCGCVDRGLGVVCVCGQGFRCGVCGQGTRKGFRCGVGVWTGV